MPAPDEDFIRQLTDCQNRLFGYLATILGSIHDARDVLQETNLVMWRKCGEYAPGSNFAAWAKRCAHFQALAYLRDRKRDRHLFDEETVTRLVEEAGLDGPFDSGAGEERQMALRECLAGLPDGKRELIRDRYRDDMPVRELAAKSGKKLSAVKMELTRIREALLLCIEGKIQEVHS